MLNRLEMTVSHNENGTFTVDNSANVLFADQEASNGWVNIIDQVLIPGAPLIPQLPPMPRVQLPNNVVRPIRDLFGLP